MRDHWDLELDYSRVGQGLEWHHDNCIRRRAHGNALWRRNPRLDVFRYGRDRNLGFRSTILRWLPSTQRSLSRGLATRFAEERCATSSSLPALEAPNREEL